MLLVCCAAHPQKLMGLDPGSEEFQAELLSYLAPLQTTLTVMTTLKLLSNHSEEEQYLSSDAELLGWLTVRPTMLLADRLLVLPLA